MFEGIRLATSYIAGNLVNLTVCGLQLSSCLWLVQRVIFLILNTKQKDDMGGIYSPITSACRML